MLPAVSSSLTPATEWRRQRVSLFSQTRGPASRRARHSRAIRVQKWFPPHRSGRHPGPGFFAVSSGRADEPLVLMQHACQLPELLPCQRTYDQRRPVREERGWPHPRHKEDSRCHLVFSRLRIPPRKRIRPCVRSSFTGESDRIIAWHQRCIQLACTGKMRQLPGT